MFISKSNIAAPKNEETLVALMSISNQTNANRIDDLIKSACAKIIETIERINGKLFANF